MQRRHCLHVGSGVLLIAVWYFWFLGPRNDPPIPLKLQANGKVLQMSKIRDQRTAFFSPSKHGTNRRELNEGLNELESQETNIRRVRPPTPMKGGQDSLELAEAAKRNKETYEDFWPKILRLRKESRNVRSVVLKDAVKGNPPFRIGNRTRNQHLEEVRLERIRNVTFQLYYLQDKIERNDVDNDLNSKLKVTSILELNEENQTNKHAYFLRTFKYRSKKKHTYKEKIIGSTNPMAEAETNETVSVLKGNVWDRYHERHGDSDRTNDNTNQTVEHLTNESAIPLKGTVEDTNTPCSNTTNCIDNGRDKGEYESTLVLQRAVKATITNKPCDTATNCTDSEPQGEADDADNRVHAVKKRQAGDTEKPIPQSFPEEVRLAVVNQLVVNGHFSHSRPLGSKVDLSCQNEAMVKFRKENPTVLTQWLLNGELLDIKTSRVSTRGNDLLVIHDLMTRDSGVYECRVEDGKNKTLTMALFALTVTSSAPTLFSRETEPIVLDSHSNHLARVLRVVDLTRATDPLFGCRPPCRATNLSQHTTRQWHFNTNKSALFPEDIPAHLSTQDRIDASTPDMAGVWWCQVYHSPSGMRWNTSWNRVHIGHPPPLIEKFWRALLRRPWLTSTLGVLFLATCIGLSVLLARCTQKQVENLEVTWQMTKAHLKRRESELSPAGSVLYVYSSLHTGDVGGKDLPSSISPAGSLPSSPESIRPAGKSQGSWSTLGSNANAETVVKLPQTCV